MSTATVEEEIVDRVVVRVFTGFQKPAMFTVLAQYLNT